MIVTDNLTIANKFNNFFVSIGPYLVDEITCTENPSSYDDSVVSSIVIQNSTMLEVQTVILSLKIKTYFCILIFLGKHYV